MSRIFLSHSSANGAEAIALRDWLIAQGFDELFLDLDPQRGLKAGERWQAALKRAAERCELVIFLISPEWVASKWCLAEFLLAQNLNKRIFGVIVAETPFADIPAEMTSEWQLVDLTAGERCHKATVNVSPANQPVRVAFSKEGLERLRLGLIESGIDARHFAWPPENDPDRAPYRGLQPLEAEDAGIFFGRDGPTVLALDLLRGLRDCPPPRLFVILGASGAGKSSFLRAGVLPRLARESQHFLCLPIVRPERAVLTGDAGLIASIEKALRDASRGHTRAAIRQAVEGGAAHVAALLQELVASRTSEPESNRKPPTLILPIDQAEELFLAEGAEEARRFLELIGQLVQRDDPAVIAVFTIRSDSYERLQIADGAAGLRQHTLSLPPMPKGAYSEVIKGPARRLEGTRRALKIEEALVDALLADVEQGGAKDALPLLAFTLERLYREHGGDGNLKLAEYEAFGRVGGSIEAAIERALKAADADPRIPRDREARLALLRRGLIPWLAGIDPETASPRRRVARLSEVPAESRPLIDLLVAQRLLSTDVSKETGEATIEPVHEALLRQWGLLQGWLTEDAGLLGVLDGIKRATRDWAANDKDPAWLTHSGQRLHAAESLAERPDLAKQLEPTDLAYLASCRDAECTAIARKRRMWVLASGLGLLLLLGGFGWAYQGYLREQGYWHAFMQPKLLSPEQERALKPGDRFSECKKGCPEMVVVPSGKFAMGSPEYVGDENEHPQHDVVIAKPFAVGRYEVTFEEWDACVISGACARVSDSGWGRDNSPAINVSWEDARRYTDWLKRVTGRNYRLLSESEWEYAARAGAQTTYPHGDDDAALGEYAWFKANSGERTQPVGHRQPNKFGLYDMHGNVWEWVQDCAHHTYEAAPSDGSAWLAGNCDLRIHRGGSWSNEATYLRSAKRLKGASGLFGRSLGFRVARDLDR